jgi:recombinational DNA repair protein (RecF pathway)
MTIRAFLNVIVRTHHCVTCHRDGKVTYFDPLHQRWIEGATTMPVYALTVLPAQEEERARRHLARNGVFP